MKWQVIAALIMVFLLFGCVKNGTTTTNETITINVDILDCPYSARMSNMTVEVSNVTLPVDKSEEACAIATQVWTSLCPGYPINGSCASGSGNYSKWMPMFDVYCENCYVGPLTKIKGAYFFINKTTGEIWGSITYLHTHDVDPRLKDLPPGQEGAKMCGGIAGFKCDEGYYCLYSKGIQPSYPDESGICVQCPQFMPASPGFISDCEAMGGTLISEKDSVGCMGPPQCKVG